MGVEKLLTRRELAHSAGLDAGNRSMRATGRTAWNFVDRIAAAAEYERVYPLVDYLDDLKRNKI